MGVGQDIGYILLIPCVIGMLIGVMMLFGMGGAVAASSASGANEVRTRLEAKAVPSAVIEEVINSKPIPQDSLSTLSIEQNSAINDARMNLSASKVGTGAGAILGGGIAIFLIIGCFVGGLLGWLLVMKKKVLQCKLCSSVLAAS